MYLYYGTFKRTEPQVKFGAEELIKALNAAGEPCFCEHLSAYLPDSSAASIRLQILPELPEEGGTRGEA